MLHWTRLISSILFQLILFGAMFFIPAGTLHWWRAWVYLGLFVVMTPIFFLLVFRGREDLLAERLKPPIQAGQPLSDKIILMTCLVLMFGAQIAIPMDVFHWHLLGKPNLLVSSLGMLLFLLSWWIFGLVFRENAFAAPVVKFQEERHQMVIDTGLYSIVRHPMYAGLIPYMVGSALWLESYVGALLSILPFLALMVRIVFEERFLKQSLSGYEAYTQRVRYRLVPFIW